MFKYVSLFQSLRPYASVFLLVCAVLVLMFFPDMAHASQTSDLPFTSGLEKLLTAMEGPIPFAISLVGIIAAGAVLIFGGEMSGFLRTMVFLVLVICIIVNAGNIVKALGGNSVTIAAQVEHPIGAIQGVC